MIINTGSKQGITNPPYVLIPMSITNPDVLY